MFFPFEQENSQKRRKTPLFGTENVKIELNLGYYAQNGQKVGYNTSREGYKDVERHNPVWNQNFCVSKNVTNMVTNDIIVSFLIMEVITMSKKSKMSPEDKLMCAIYGKSLNEVTEADVERLRRKFPELMAKIDAKQDARLETEIGEAVNSVTDDDFKKMWGCSIEESVHRSMLFAGWLEAVWHWKEQHADDRKYHVIGDKPKVFTVMQVVDMAQLFYRQGQEDGKHGVEEYDRLWKVNRQCPDGEG